MLLKLVIYFILKILEGIVSVALTITIVTPSLIVIFIINQSIRAVLSVVIYYKYKGLCKLTDNGLDNIWGYESDNGGNCRNVLFIAIYDHKIDGYRYRSKFLNEVINFVAPDGTQPYLKLKKIFTSAYGYFCWKEDINFDISNHIIVLPEEKVVTETEMFQMLGDLSKDMSDTVPQWQEIIVPRFQYDKYRNIGVPNGGNENGKEQSLRILRFHHSYGDAGSWILLYSYCMAGGKIPYAVNPLKGYPIPLWQKFLYYLNAIIFGATTALRAMWHGQNVNNRLVTRNYSQKKFYAWSELLDLNILKEIKKKTNTAIPTALACVVASAIRNFDQRFPSKERPIGEVMDIGAVAAILPYPNLHPQNRFTIANFPVPTGDMSRVARLKLTHRNGMKLTKSPEPVLNFHLFKFFGKCPIPVQKVMMQSAGTSVIFSNLPGASETFSLWGDTIAEGGAWVPLLTVAGLSIAAAGYKSGVRICAVADSACMSKPELDFILAELKNEIHALAAETIGLA